MHTIEQVLDLDGMRVEIADLGEQVAAPDLWDDQDNATRVTGRLSDLQGQVDRFTELESRHRGPRRSWSSSAARRATPASLAEAEVELRKVEKAVEALEVRTLLSGEYDVREALVTIRSGAGGVDAADFAEMLMRMYTALGRAAQATRSRSSRPPTPRRPASSRPPSPSTRRTPTARSSVEAGTHRLVRISPFDNQGRRQTASRRSRSCRCSSRPTRSTSPTRTSASTSTDPAVPAASRSTPPTPPSG